MIDKETNTMAKMEKEILNDLKFMSYVPVLFLSALTGRRVNTVLSKVKEVVENYRRRIPTGVLNEALADAQMTLQPPIQGGRKLKIYYVTQQCACPPTFVFFVNDKEMMHFAYERYLENHLRKSFAFAGTPIRFILREKEKS